VEENLIFIGKSLKISKIIYTFAKSIRLTYKNPESVGCENTD
jgi:hypothetical protein